MRTIIRTITRTNKYIEHLTVYKVRPRTLRHCPIFHQNNSFCYYIVVIEKLENSEKEKGSVVRQPSSLLSVGCGARQMVFCIFFLRNTVRSYVMVYRLLSSLGIWGSFDILLNFQSSAFTGRFWNPFWYNRLKTNGGAQKMTCLRQEMVAGYQT